MTRLGIILVLYNQKHNLDVLYSSLTEQTFKDFSIYFVDNNPQHGAVEHSKDLNIKYGFDIRYYPQLTNTGFAGGSNIGAIQAIQDGCDNLLVLNNDMELHKNCLEELNSLLISTGAGVVAPLVLIGKSNSDSNIIQEYGGQLNLRTYSLKKYYEGQSYSLQKNILPQVQKVDFVCGGATLIRSSIVKEIGLWDERYFAYGDEIDLSKRLHEKNIQLYVTSRAIIWHHHQWDRNNRIGYYFEYFMIQRNKYLYFIKYRYFINLFIALLKDFFRLPLTLRWHLKICDVRLFFYYIKGIAHGLMNHKGAPLISFK